jgi:hypothetical protein
MKTWDETKEQRKRRKALEKQGLSTVEQNDHKTDYLEEYKQSANKNYVVCLKWGDKYSSDYVNKLYNMVKRNLTIEYEFVCFTENPKGIDRNIVIKPLPVLPLTGWWYKPWFLSNQTDLNGTVLFLDLDLIVFRNIDHLFTYKPESSFVIIRDFNRQVRQQWDKMNSSVFRFRTQKYSHLFDDFFENHKSIVRRYQGDQDWMYANIKDHVFWPDIWIQSYKWEMRGRETLGIINGKRNFRSPGEPKIDTDTKIAVFHGHPNIHECNDKWPGDNWY